jgi:hypothetical protein
MTMYGPDLKIVETVVNLPVGPDGTGVIDIVSQPLSLLLLHRDSIDFYKLSSNQLQARNGSCIAP